MPSVGSRRALVLEVRVLREDLLEVLGDRLGLGLLDLLALRGAAKLAPDAVEELVAVVVHVREDALAGLAREDVLDARASVLVHACEHFVRLAEEVVEVAENVLVGPDEAEADVIGRAFPEFVEGQRFLDVSEVDELLDLAVRVARDVGERPVLRGSLAQAVDREDREELVDRPDVRQGLEDRHVHDVLVGQHDLELLELLGDVLERVEMPPDPVADVPVEDLALAPVLERDVAEIEEREKLLLVLERVVVALAHRLRGDALPHVVHLAHDVVLVAVELDGAALLDAVRHVENVRHEDRVICRDGPARLRDERRDGDLLLVADRLDRVDDVVRVLLHRVVHRGVERRLAAVVVHAEPAAEVQELHLHARPVQLRVDAARLLDRLLDLPDVRDLRADVEVEHDEAVEHLPVAENLDGFEHLGRRETELRGLAPRLRPLARAARVELAAHPDQGLHAALLRDVEDALELGDLFEDEDHGLAHPDAVQREPDERVVLVAVRRDEAVRAEVLRKGREELGLAPGLEAVAVLAAGLDDLLHDDLLLVHLDREDAAKDAVVLVLPDRVQKGLVQLLHGGVEDLREPDDDRRRDAAQRDVVDDGLEVHEAVVLARRVDEEVSVVRDGEEALAPVFDAVELLGLGELLGGADAGRFRGPRAPGDCGVARHRANLTQGTVEWCRKFRR